MIENGKKAWKKSWCFSLWWMNFISTVLTVYRIPQMPPMSVHWDKERQHQVSSLLSPTKNLLPATANPLMHLHGSSSFFASSLLPSSGRENIIIAPHPSELPLPNMSSTTRNKSIMTTSGDYHQSRSSNADSGISGISGIGGKRLDSDSGSGDACPKRCQYLCCIYNNYGKHAQVQPCRFFLFELKATFQFPFLMQCRSSWVPFVSYYIYMYIQDNKYTMHIYSQLDYYYYYSMSETYMLKHLSSLFVIRRCFWGAFESRIWQIRPELPIF